MSNDQPLPPSEPETPDRMPPTPKKVAILGSTGSIGRSTLDVIAASGGSLCAVALSAHENVPRLLEQARRFQPRQIVITCPQAAVGHDFSEFVGKTEVLVGAGHIAQLASSA
ncbi:MAG: hypothetical protein ACYC6Y_31400, partial [Thermoguttaceae bacterium]